MSHNQILSHQLAYLFHIPTITLSSFSSSVQTFLRNNFQDLSDHVLRPTQLTTLTGFRWSVNTGHYSAKAIISRPLKILAVNPETPRLHHAPPLCQYV